MSYSKQQKEWEQIQREERLKNKRHLNNKKPYFQKSKQTKEEEAEIKNPMILTKKMIDALRTEKGGLNLGAQKFLLKTIGLKYGSKKVKKGWVKAMENSNLKVSVEEWREVYDQKEVLKEVKKIPARKPRFKKITKEERKAMNEHYKLNIDFKKIIGY